MAVTILTRLMLDNSQFAASVLSSRKKVAQFDSGIKKIGSLGSAFLSPLAGMAGFAGITAAIGSAISNSIEFEKSLSQMSSLTGAAGAELEYYKEQAIALGASTTQTASQVVDAFKLIGSQMPQLLGAKDALVAVTQEAITLAEAAGIEVPEAAKALAGSLNQMGAGAEYASSYINILAAASQKGSADIPYLNQAIEKSGGTASSVGVKFSELVAAIEAIAPKVTDAATAGTSLRNIFMLLEKNGPEQMKVSVVGFNKALENLANANLSTTEMMKLFGMENINAALALVRAKDECVNLQKAITGTNTAYDQANTNTNNVAGSVTKLSSAWEGFTLSLNNSQGAIKETVDLLTKVVTLAGRMMKNPVQIRTENLQKGTSETLKTSYRHIATSEDSGLSRSAAYAKEIKRLRQEDKRLTKARNAEALKYRDLKRSNDLGMDAAKAHASLGVAGVKMDSNRNAIRALESQARQDTATPAIPSVIPFVTTASKNTKRSTNRVKAENPHPLDGSIDKINEDLSGLNKQLNAATTDEVRAQIQAKIDTLEATKKAIDEKLNPKEEKPKDAPLVEGADVPAALNAKIAQYDEAQKAVERLKEAQDYATEAEKADIQERIDKWKEYQATLGIMIPDTQTKQTTATENTAEDLEKLGSSMQSLGNSVGGNAGEWLSWVGNITSSIASAIIAVHNLTIANTANAAAGAASSVSSIPFVGPMLAASAVASVLAAIASTPSGFATGGIVGGANYNDGINARLSSGEMVINQADQKKLFDSLHSGSNGGTTASTRISAEDIVVTVNNYGRRIGKGKLINV